MTATDIEQETNPNSPEKEAMLTKFKGLAGMAAEWPAVQERKTHKGPNGEDIKVYGHDGIGLVDIEGFIQGMNPSNEVGETQVQAARLFNRMVMEKNELPVPEDLSRMDESSYSARLDPIDVMQYAVAHSANHISTGDPRDMSRIRTLITESATTYFGSTNPGVDPNPDRIQQYESILYNSARGSGRLQTKYAALPEY